MNVLLAAAAHKDTVHTFPLSMEAVSAGLRYMRIQAEEGGHETSTLWLWGSTRNTRAQRVGGPGRQHGLRTYAGSRVPLGGVTRDADTHIVAQLSELCDLERVREKEFLADWRIVWREM